MGICQIERSLINFMKKRMSNTLIALLITMILLVVTSSIWVLYYAVNDDVTIGQRLSGCYTGVPRPAANDLQYPLALIISILYRIFPKVDIYGLFLNGSHYLCIFLIIKRVLCKIRENKAGSLILLYIVILTIDIQNIIFFQFTTTAAVYAVSGVFLLLLEEPDEKKWGSSIICLFMAFCVRKQIFGMIAPFVVLAWLVKLYQSKLRIKDKLKMSMFFFLILGTLIGSANVIHKFADREHFFNENLNEFISGRSNIRDYDGVPDYDTNIEFYQNIGGKGISKAEYRLIRYQMVSMDFSVDIQDIVKEMHQYNIIKRNSVGLKDRLAIMKSKFITVWNRALIKPQIVIIIITFFFMGIYLVVGQRWVWLLFLTSGLSGVGSEMVYLLYRNRLNERVVKSLALVAVLWMFGILVEVLYGIGNSDKSRYKIHQVIYVCLVSAYMVTFVVGMIPAIGEKQTEYEKRYHMSTVVNEYCAEHSDNIYFSCYNFLSGDTSKLGKEYNLRFENRIRIGLLVFTPAYYERLERAGIVGTIEEAITTQDNIFLMGQNVDGQLPELDSYFREKYGDAYSYEVVDILDESVYIWKVHLSNVGEEK